MIERDLLITEIRKHGLQKVAEGYIRQGKEGWEYKIRHRIPMTKAEERRLLYRQKIGIKIYNALLGPCEGERTPELAVENLMQLLKKRPYLRNFV